MKTICLNFNIHKTYIQRKYRFFDIGTNNYYFDDFADTAQLQRAEANCLKPACEMLLSLIKHNKKNFKFSVTISGSMLEQLERDCPVVVDLLKQMAATGCVEFICTPYNHSLAALKDVDEFKHQVKQHSQTLARMFGVKPKTFQNTELIFSDQIAKVVEQMKFQTMLVEGAGRSLDLRGPNFVYFAGAAEKLKVLPRNQGISQLMENGLKDNKLFSPLYFANQLFQQDEYDNVINIRINYEVLNTAVFNNRDVLLFFKNLTEKIIGSGVYKFATPSQAIKEYQPVAPFTASHPISGMNKEHNMQPWLGNELQQEAFDKLYALSDKMKLVTNKVLLKIWEKIQCSDYFYYMSTQFFENLDYNYKPNPYQSPYEAFINYMNILGDFERRVNQHIENTQANTLTDKQIDEKIKFYEEEIRNLKNTLKERKK